MSVIDVATNTVQGTIKVGTEPRAVAITPNGSVAYVTNEGSSAVRGSSTVSVIEVATNTVHGTIKAGGEPIGIAITPDGKDVYVARIHADKLSEIKTSSNAVVASVRAGFEPWGLAISPDGRLGLVTESSNYGGNAAMVFKPSRATVGKVIPVGGTPTAVAFIPDGSAAYVTNSGSNTVSVIDTATKDVTAVFTVGTRPTGVAFT